MSAACHNHPGVEAAGACAGCAETFCGNCLLELDGNLYCGSCKVMALRGRTPMLESAMRPSPAAGEAMKIANAALVLGILVCLLAAMNIFARIAK